MQRGCDSVPPVVEEEKHGKSRLHSGALFPGAVPCPVPLSCLAQPGANGPHLVVGSRRKAARKTIPASFEAHSWGTYPTRVEAFPTLFLEMLHAPQSRGLVTRAFEHQKSLHIGEHGSVFTQGPSPCNPYTLQFESDYQRILFEWHISGNAPGKG
jgi:hypothetical protein